MKKLNISLENYSYNIFINNGILDDLGSYIANVYKGKNIFVITDDIVEKLYLSKLIESLSDYNVKAVTILHGEASKSLNQAASVCESLLELGIKRNELLIALGGGVVGDLCGFVSSILYRGIPYVGIPTTLLSQVDSSIGGKTGVDFFNRKNILGTFKQPLAVYIDPLLLNTLDKREFNNGMAELIKHAAIGNEKLFYLLENKNILDEEIIYESLLVKREAVQRDVYDQYDRMKLNFGHTFGHVIELEYNLKHGEAVAIGMLMAIKLGIALNITDKSCYDRLKNLLEKYMLPTTDYSYKNYLEQIVYDKKNLAGTINFILLSKIGSCLIYKIRDDELNNLK